MIMNATRSLVLPDNIFQTIFEKSPGSLLVKADLPDFTIMAASDAFLSISSIIREDVVGRSFFDVFPTENDPNKTVNTFNIFCEVVKKRKVVEVPDFRFDVYDSFTNKSETHYWSCSNTPIFGADNNVAYILKTVVDITGEIRAKKAAIESGNRLRLVTEAAALATWELELKDQSFTYSPRLVEIFGHSLGTSITLEQIRSQINAEDMKNIIAKAYREALATGNYLYVVRVLWPDGSLHWIKTQGVVIWGEEKTALRMMGTILDITESKSDEIRKNDFIAMASHELKTPLTSIKAYLQMVAKRLNEINDSFVTNAVSKSLYQVNKMADLIHGFLDLSKLESGKLQLNPQSFDINELIDEVIAETDLTSPGTLINFDRNEIILATADREKIEQVIRNFISNAIKYSDKGSEIAIHCKKTAEDVQVSVTDKGIGIKPKDQERLFQRFYRVESEKMKNIAGFGIGLYLSSEIIQRHRGKIGVQSDENKGATFYFSLPLTT